MENTCYDNRGFNIKCAALSLDSLCIYRNLLQDPVLDAYRALLRHAAGKGEVEGLVGLYAGFFNLLASNSAGVNLPEYVAGKIVFDENPFTLSAGRQSNDTGAAALSEAAGRDLEALQASAALSPGTLKSCLAGHDSDGSCLCLIERLPEWKYRQEDIYSCDSSDSSDSFGSSDTPDSSAADGMKKLLLSSGRWADCLGELYKFHRENGAGCFSGFRAFNWQPDRPGGFIPVANPDPVRLSDLIDYESEREEVVRNTEQFLGGYPANNVLLYGDRGTGKSSTVKALLNEYAGQGLRMIEVSKSRLADFPEIIRRLAGRNHKFIIFVDDLTFEDNEENYTALKAVLEGGLETRPANVLIYATSNRRHLIRENFSDRAGLQYGGKDDEVRAADTMQEKLSLSDRFGITVVFSSPDKKRYLRIIEELTARKGLRIDREALHKEALKWELWYNGRSPRTARQFISWLEGSLRG